MVTEVSASTLPPDRLQTGLVSPQHLLTLSSVEDDGLGEELNVLWEQIAFVEMHGNLDGCIVPGGSPCSS
jgi:hypothetical protein